MSAKKDKPGRARLSPEGLQKLSDTMRRLRANPEITRRAQEASAAARAEKANWPAEKMARLRALLDQGASIRLAAMKLGVSRESVALRIGENRWKKSRVDQREAANKFLQEHYAGERAPIDLLPEYVAILGITVGVDALRTAARALGLSRPSGRKGEPKIPRWQAKRVEDAPAMQAALDAGEGRHAARKRLRIGYKRFAQMVAEGVLKIPPPPPKAPKPPKVVVVKPPKPPKPPRVVKQSLTTAPRASRSLPTILFGSKDIRRPVVGPVQSVEEFLAAGGKVTTCPAVAVAATTATISDADRAAAAAHTMARGGYGYTDTWRAINKRIQTAAKKAKAEAESRSGPDEQIRIAA